MLRTSFLAALTVTLLGGSAFAQGAPAADSAPHDLSVTSRPLSAPDQSAQAAPAHDDSYDDNGSYDDRGPYDDRGRDDYRRDSSQPARQAADSRSRDMFCRRDAAARTGYVTPGEAARNEQTQGTIGGTLGGAALGAIIGGIAGNAGTGAAIGAGTGLLAGTAVGSSNAREAAASVRDAYSRAYWDCMDEAHVVPPAQSGYQAGYEAGYYDGSAPPPPPRYIYAPPPPPPAYYYRPYGYPYYPYYYGSPYGSSLGLSFSFGGRDHWRGRHR
jgi:hypothetical protein